MSSERKQPSRILRPMHLIDDELTCAVADSVTAPPFYRPLAYSSHVVDEAQPQASTTGTGMRR